ncbi:MAG: hypothetical protein N3F09_09285, partial [Bacteroidia bacterium]|nr:hypothetical protein [Bacteroidia bacterium]
SMGSQQMVSVPYALYAKTAGNINLFAGQGISITNGTISNTAPNQTVSLAQGTNITVSGSYPHFTIHSTPSLSINNNTLSISGGNSVTLPVSQNQTVTGINNAIVSQPVTNSFVVNVPQQTLSISSAFSSPTLISTLGGSVAIPAPSISINSPHNISPTSGYSMNLNIQPPVLSPTSAISLNNVAQVTSTPGSLQYSITVPPASLSIINGIGTSTLTLNHGSLSVATVTFNNGAATNIGWSLIGNALGTNSITNFLGTTDNTPINFRVQSIQSGKFIFDNTAGRGLLGLGIASDHTFTPQSLLHLSMPNTFTSAIRLGHSSKINTEWHFDVDINSNMFLINENSGNPFTSMTFSNNGRIGIHTNNLTGLFNITNPTGTNIPALSINNSNNSSGININHSGSGDGVTITKSNLGQAIYASSTSTIGAGIYSEKTGSGMGEAAAFLNSSSTNTSPVLGVFNQSGNGDVIYSYAFSSQSKNCLVLNNGHIKSIGSQPLYTLTASSNIISIVIFATNPNNTDVKGNITFSLIASIANFGSSDFINLKVNFNKTYQNTPIVVIAPTGNTDMCNLGYRVKNVTTSSFEIEIYHQTNSGIISVPPGKSFSFNYFVIE